jgi:hypothetical protein
VTSTPTSFTSPSATLFLEFTESEYLLLPILWKMFSFTKGKDKSISTTSHFLWKKNNTAVTDPGCRHQFWIWFVTLLTVVQKTITLS